MTPEQKEIVAILQQHGGEVTKAQVVKAIGGDYYANGAKHVGDRLSRMVNAGILVRVKPGVFTLGTGRKPAGATEDKNQLFIHF
jgi:hypothetical protein